MLNAAEMRYIQGMGNDSIAQELGISTSTVEGYFSSDQMQQYEEYFSDEARKFLKVQMKQRIEDGTKLANNLLAQAIQDQDASPRTKVKAAKEAQKIPDRYIKMMQELGVIQKPKERKEVENKETESSLDKLAKIYEQERDEEKVES